MWFTQPAYNNYTPYAYAPQYYVYLSPQNPLTGAITSRDRAAREREVATRRRSVGPPRGYDTTRSPFSSYPSNDEDGGSFVPYPYDPRSHNYTNYVYEDPKRSQTLERERQTQLTHQAELDRSREAKRARKLAKLAHKSQEPVPISISTPHSSIHIFSPNVSSSVPQDAKPPRPPKYPSAPPSPKPETGEETLPEMRVEEFYEKRLALLKALASINAVSVKFEKSKEAFSPPNQLYYKSDSNSFIPIETTPESYRASFEDTEGSTDSSNPGLAFISNNRRVHKYNEFLDELLEEIDKVESGGNAWVREQRKKVVEGVNGERDRIDRWIEAVWNRSFLLAPGKPRPRGSPKPWPGTLGMDAYNTNHTYDKHQHRYR